MSSGSMWTRCSRAASGKWSSTSALAICPVTRPCPITRSGTAPRGSGGRRISASRSVVPGDRRAAASRTPARSASASSAGDAPGTRQYVSAPAAASAPHR